MYVVSRSLVGRSYSSLVGSGVVAPNSGRSLVAGVHVVSGVGHHVIDWTKALLGISWGSMCVPMGATCVPSRRWAFLARLRFLGWVGYLTAWVGGTSFCV